MARTKKNTSQANLLPFPERLRELLDRPGETQTKLAKIINVHQQTISLWKDGKTAPDIYSLEKIADYYNVSVDYLLGYTDLQSPNIEDIAIYQKFGLSEEAMLHLQIINKYDFNEELSKLITNQKLIDALLLIYKIRTQHDVYLAELKSIADEINAHSNLSSRVVAEMIENKQTSYRILCSDSFKTLYITDYIDFLRLKLIDTMNSIVSEITEIKGAEDEYIIKTLIGFLDKKDLALYNQKVDAIKNFNTSMPIDISNSIEG